MATDSEVILLALQKERDELHEKIMQVDRIIKRVKSLEGADMPVQQDNKQPNPNQQPLNNILLRRVDIKVQVLRVFDLLKVASKLSEIQREYNQVNGNKYGIREIIRALNKAGLLLLMRDKSKERGELWVKREWLDNGQLRDEFKPEGFDLLYDVNNMIYE